MGFSQIAAFTILASSTLVFAGTMTGQIFNAQEEWNDAWLDAERLSSARRHDDITITDSTFNQNPTATLTLTIQNSGSETLSASRLSYLVEVYYYGQAHVASAEVAGVSADTWPPGTVLVVELDVERDFEAPAPDPVMAAVVTEYGTLEFWRA